MKIGSMELIVVLIVLLVVLGPKQTVLYARKLGKLLRVLKVYLGSLMGELQETVVEPLQEMNEPLKEMVKPLEDLAQTVQMPVPLAQQTSKPAAEQETAAKQPAEQSASEEILEYAEPEEDPEDSSLS